MCSGIQFFVVLLVLTLVCCCACSENAAHARHLVRNQRIAWVKHKTQQLALHMKLQLTKAELVELPAGGTFIQQSSMVLMRGGIDVKVQPPKGTASVVDVKAGGMGVSAAEVARWCSNAGRHNHQSILPWVWEVLTQEELRNAPGRVLASVASWNFMQTVVA